MFIDFTTWARVTFVLVVCVVGITGATVYFMGAGRHGQRLKAAMLISVIFFVVVDPPIMFIGAMLPHIQTLLGVVGVISGALLLAGLGAKYLLLPLVKTGASDNKN